MIVEEFVREIKVILDLLHILRGLVLNQVGGEFCNQKGVRERDPIEGRSDRVVRPVADIDIDLRGYAFEVFRRSGNNRIEFIVKSDVKKRADLVQGCKICHCEDSFRVGCSAI